MREGAIFYGVLFLSLLAGQDRCWGFFVPLRKFTFSQKFYQERLTNALWRIDTNAVYLRYNEETQKYRFMRFFSDGVVYMSCTFHSEPDSADYNNLCAGRLIDSGVSSWYGMYYITGDTLFVEFAVPFLGYDWRYQRYYISPSGDSLVLRGGHMEGTLARKSMHTKIRGMYMFVSRFLYGTMIGAGIRRRSTCGCLGESGRRGG